MEKSVKERLQVQILIEIGIFFVFGILNMLELFNFNQLIYNILDLFNKEYSTILEKILEILPILNCLFIVYIISININFCNVKFLTQQYIDEYIVKTVIVNLVIYIFIGLYCSLIYYQYGSVVIISHIIFVFIFFILKILYTKIYFKRKSRKFITEEEYVKEHQIPLNTKEEHIDEVLEKKVNNNKKKIDRVTCIFFILCILNLFILFFVPSCGLFETCHPDGFRIVIINFIVLFCLYIIIILIIFIQTISISSSNKKE